MPETHLWLAAAGCSELTIRRSRFLGHARNCPTETEAQRILNTIRTEHPKADHHVFAWRIRDRATGQLSHRFDDDGEPGGTAGRPLLQVLESQQVVNAQLVVVRYFGGIKLGAGGLLRAYSEAASKALGDAHLRRLVLTQTVVARVRFNHLATLERLVVRHGATVCERRFGADATLVLDVPTPRLEVLRRELLDLTQGTAHVEEGSGGEA